MVAEQTPSYRCTSYQQHIEISNYYPSCLQDSLCTVSMPTKAAKIIVKTCAEGDTEL